MAARQSLAAAYRRLDAIDEQTAKLAEAGQEISIHLEEVDGLARAIDRHIMEMRPPAERNRAGEMADLDRYLRLALEDLKGSPIRLDLQRLVETLENALELNLYAQGAVAAMSHLRRAIAVADT